MPKGNEKSSQYTAAKARQFEPGDGGHKNASFTDGTAFEFPFSSGTAAARPAAQLTVTNERGVQRCLVCTHFARTHARHYRYTEYWADYKETEVGFIERIFQNTSPCQKSYLFPPFASNLLWVKSF